MKIIALNSIFKNSLSIQNTKRNPVKKINFKSQSDSYCDSKNTEIDTFSKLAEEKSPKIKKRYLELISNKELNLTPFEAYLYANKHNLSDIFKYSENDEYYDSEGFEKEHREIALNYAYFCTKGNSLSDEDIKKCNQFKKEFLNNRFNGAKCLKFIALTNGYSPLKINLCASEAKYFIKHSSELEEINHYIDFLIRNPHIREVLESESKKGGEFKIERIQETDDYQIVSQINENLDGLNMQHFTVITSEGIIEKSKSVIEEGKIISYKNSPRIINIANNNDGAEDIEEMFDVCLDKNQSAYQIIHTYQAPFLDSAYETIIHPIYEHLSEIDCKTVQEICDNTTGFPIAKVTQYKDGGVEYEQFYSNNGTKLESYYYQNKDNSKNIYTIRIEDNGQEILNLYRSFEIVDENTTVTTVNDKQYICKFNDSALTIIEDEKETKLNIEDYFILGPNKNELSFIKTIPADILLKIPKTKCKIRLLNDISGGFMCYEYKEILSECNLSILSHEIGHGLDYFSEKEDDSPSSNISQDLKLKEIYNEELKRYQELFPYKTQNMTIDYFSKTGITTPENLKILNTGLSEIVAETQSLLTSFAVIDKSAQFRCNALIKYFPKTIAYCAKMLLEKTKN